MAQDTHVLAAPPEGAGADWTIPQGWEHYTAEEHATWDTLFARQSQLLPGRRRKRIFAGWTCSSCRGRAFPISRNCPTG